MTQSKPRSEHTKPPKYASIEDFYARLNTGFERDKINEVVYNIFHTTYLKKDSDYRLEIGKAWKARLNLRLSDEAFVFLRELFCCFADRTFIKSVRSGERLARKDLLWHALIGLQMDIKLIECAEREEPFEMKTFRAEMNEKYGGAFDREIDEIERNEVPYVKNFLVLGRGLHPNKRRIHEVFEKLLETNGADLNAKLEQFKADAREIAEQTTGLLMTREEYEEKIRRLESDVREFQRQRDELREYSQKQYDRGVRDLFKLMLDERYGRVADYFYKLMKSETTDDNLRGCLENLFMALEDFDIMPIISDGKIPEVTPERIVQYNLEFDRTEYDPSKTEVKYPGWRFGSFVLEKPTLTMKK